jgi:dTDP-glucose 4,6-dehydratase
MNNFGEMQSPSKYTAKIQSLLAQDKTVEVHSVNGEIGTRYYLHSRNAADAVLFILQKTSPKHHTPGATDMPDRYNIVGDAQIDNLELAKIVARLMGKELKYELVDFHSSQPGHDMHYGLDGSKLANLGWKPPVDFETSMLKTIEWQQDNSQWI